VLQRSPSISLLEIVALHLLVFCHPILDCLLGVSNVLHAGDVADSAVHYYLLSTFAIVEADCPWSTVTVHIREV
jgi:hypothetical protein